MKDVAIDVRRVTKSFRMPKKKTDTLKQLFTQVFDWSDRGHEIYTPLNDISFRVKKGEFFGVLGRNGAGKSTLLKIMAEIYQPTKGHIKSHGRLVPFIELGVGFNNNLSGRENVYMNGALLGFSKKEIDERYNTIVEFAELEDFMDQKLKNYSSGMKVRLAFSIAVQADADILLLDEVLAVGDAEFQRKCYEYFDSLKEKNKTIIFVTHNMGAVRKFCDRAILIEKGRIACEGDAEDVADEYQKLFVSMASNEKTKEAYKSNDGSAEFDYVNISATPKELKIDLEIKALENLKDARVAVVVRTKRGGKIIAGTNTAMLNNRKHFSMKEGEVKKFNLNLKNNIGIHNFVVSAYLKSNKGTRDNASWEGLMTIANPANPSGFPMLLQPSVSDEE